MELRKVLFWDIDFDKINLEKDKDLIIQRIVDFGTWKELMEILKFYGDDTIINSLMKNSELNKRGMYFAAHFFNKKISDFKCYELKQLSQIHLPF